MAAKKLKIEDGDGLVLPEPILKALGLNIGDSVLWKIQDGRLILTPKETKLTQPEKLYKYRSVGNVEDCCCCGAKESTRLKKFFETGEDWFAQPSKFNDPYDMKASIELPGTDSGWEKLFAEHLSRKNPNQSKEEIQSRARAIVLEANPSSARYQDDVEEGFQLLLDKCGVYCLAERPDEILMWSHYAQEHTGICLEFNNAGAWNIRYEQQDLVPFPVDYVTDHPGVREILEFSRQDMENILLSKYEKWRYEKEWRFIVPNGFGLQQIPLSLLSGVYFGCEMSEDNRKMVAGWVKEGPAEPTFYEMIKKDGEYGLDSRIWRES